MEDAIEVEANSLTKVRSTWRELSVDDIESLVRVADKIHPLFLKVSKSSPSASGSSPKAA